MVYEKTTNLTSIGNNTQESSRLSRKLANAYDCICIEELKMRTMSKALKFGESVCDDRCGMFTTFLKKQARRDRQKIGED